MQAISQSTHHTCITINYVTWGIMHTLSDRNLKKKKKKVGEGIDFWKTLQCRFLANSLVPEWKNRAKAKSDLVYFLIVKLRKNNNKQNFPIFFSIKRIVEHSLWPQLVVINLPDPFPSPKKRKFYTTPSRRKV